jgi:hypothetical protein
MMRLHLHWKAGLIILAGLMCAIAVTPVRRAALRTAGWAIVTEDSLQRADAIVISVDANGAGVLEAADLVRRGISTRVSVFQDAPDVTDREFVRRGVPYYDAAALSVEQLRALGVAAVEIIPRSVLGTTDEGEVLPRWCAANHIRTVIFVATTDHSRRSHRVLNRALRGSASRVIVRYSRYSLFDPDNWWRTRGGVRIELVELQKLLGDVLRHPLS